MTADYVMVELDMEVFQLAEGHGDWATVMNMVHVQEEKMRKQIGSETTLATNGRD